MPGVAGIRSGPYYSFFELPTSARLLDVFDMMDDVWDSDVPFDGFVGFSQDASVLASYLLQNNSTKKPFRCAILFCSSVPYNPHSPPWRIAEDGSFRDACTGELIVREELTSSIPEVLTLDRSKYPGLGELSLLWRYSVECIDDSARIDVPTVHVYASSDEYYDQSERTSRLC